MTSGEPAGAPAVTNSRRVFPMSLEQEALWLDDFVHDGQSRHLESWGIRLTGRLDVDALEWAVGQVIARHEVLRSRLTEKDESPVQIVTDPGPVELTKVSCSAATLTAELSRIGAEPLDLDKAPVRPWLVRLSADEFVLVVQFHHAVIDDWSLDILQREVMHFYTARLLGRSPTLEPLRMQAGEFAIAQRAAGLDEADLAYWRERVRDAPPSCTIPPDREGSDELPHRAGQHLFELSPELGQEVRAASLAMRASTFTLCASSMAVLLWEYGRADEVIFGTPVSLRGSAAVDGMIGCLTNLHPLRLAVSSDMSFRTLVGATKREVARAIEHRAVPYSTIVRMLRSGSAADGPALCDVSMVVDDMRWEPFSLPDISTEAIRLPAARAKFALHLALTSGADGGFAGALGYDAEIFDEATVARVASRFVHLLAHCIGAPDEPLGKIPGFPDEQGR